MNRERTNMIRAIELRCKKCNKVLGFLKSKYWLKSTDFECLNCYFDGLRSQEKI